MRNDTRRTFARTMRSFAAFMLAVCLLAGMVPAAFAAGSVGNKSGSLTPSGTKWYIKLSKAVQFFTGETSGKGSTVNVSAGTVCQLVTNDWYTAGEKDYYSVYYNNKRYNVLRSDVKDDVMTEEERDAYITNTLWRQSSYTTLRRRDGLVGDIRVHAVQLALAKLGYLDYTLIDGEYGEKTSAAVRKFQTDKGLGRDGSAGPLTQPVLFTLALGGTVSSGSSSSTTTTTTPSSSSGTLRTKTNVAVRKYGSVGSTRLTYVPANVNLSFSDTYQKGNVTWYRVRYNSKTGWVMGTYVDVTSGGGSSSTGGSTIGSAAIGTVTITKPGTRVRLTANGQKSGTVLAKGTVVDLLAQPTSAGGYTWYNIRTKSGLVGFVRGDCSKASIGTSGSSGSSSSLPVSADKTFVKLPAKTKLFKTETKPSSGGVNVAANTVLMMYSTTTYKVDGIEYCSLYFNNEKYNAVYSEVSGGIMTLDAVSSHITSLLNGTLSGALKREMDLVGDVRVYALQTALHSLGYYTGKIDGDFGAGTQSAVRNFQRKVKITVDGSCGNETWKAISKALSGATGGTAGSGTTVSTFGTVTSIQKMTWDGDGQSFFPKNSYATVLDITTGKVFQIYRWSGGNHADCVPASTADTKVMCDIVDFPYNSKYPSTAQLKLIKQDSVNNNATYAWPDFNNKWGNAKDIKDAWDRRPALLKVNGSTTAYAVSIFGYPHGYDGTSAFSKATYNSGANKGKLFHDGSNYYGMMCVHFVGSTTHTSTTPNKAHQEAIETAYKWAQKEYPGLVK